MTGLHRIGVKVFCTKCALDPSELIPVFHRWIQRKQIGEMLIDVADYTHVPAGPGILLVAHEGNYSFDDAQDRRGLTYLRKQPLPASTLFETIHAVAREAVNVASALEAEPEVVGRLTFDGSELSVCFNDRLEAANTDAVVARVEPDVSRFFDATLGTERSGIARATDHRERLKFGARSARPVPLRELASRLAG